MYETCCPLYPHARSRAYRMATLLHALRVPFTRVNLSALSSEQRAQEEAPKTAPTVRIAIVGAARKYHDYDLDAMEQAIDAEEFTNVLKEALVHACGGEQ